MKKTTLLVLAVLLGSNFAAAAPRHFAPQNGHHAKHERDGLPRGFEQLNLSDAQKAQIKAIVEAGRNNEDQNPRTQMRQPMQQKRDNHRQQERALMDNKQFDEQAARKMIAERRQARMIDEQRHAERELQMLKRRHAIFQVLTPEQQAQYRQLRENKMKPRHTGR